MTTSIPPLPGQPLDIQDAMVVDQKKDFPHFHFLGYRVTYIKSEHPSGWCRPESDFIAKSLFCIESKHEPIPSKTGGLVKASGWRIVAGKHSIWIMA